MKHSCSPFVAVVVVALLAILGGLAAQESWTLWGAATDKALLVIKSTSPGDGEDGVALSRETIIEFSGPLAMDEVGETAVQVTQGGEVIPARLQLSGDRRRLTLFYQRYLPGSARVAVTLDGDQFLDGEGRAVDADGDGSPGGVAVFTFDTLSITPVIGTSVTGRVMASELLGDKGGEPFLNYPLENARVAIDGLEASHFVYTDAAGNFTLENVPAGEFFVHIDGRSVTHTPGGEITTFPNGPYYPYVGKKWESDAGRETNVGTVFLPLIPAGTLKPVFPSATTQVLFPQSVLDTDPALANVVLIVPPNSLYANNGQRGGRVGIAPVDPSRLPEPLPEDFAFPLVITVQTDGPENFDDPPPICFPNLPDPVTGEVLPPGAKSSLWSFNHDTGFFEIAGPMTVSLDGTLVCSDEGFGVPAPGWHGVQPGTQARGGPIEGDEENECSVFIAAPLSGSVGQQITFGTNIPTNEGGAFAWASPLATPSFGSDRTFNASWDEAGTYSVFVQYIRPGGEGSCSFVHQITILGDPCDMSIVGPDRVNQGLEHIYTADVPAGTPVSYQWTATGAFVSVGTAIQPAFGVTFHSRGKQTISLTYEYIDEIGEPQYCSVQFEVTVTAEVLVIAHRGAPVLDGASFPTDTPTEFTPSQSESEGTWAWSCGPDANPPSGSSYVYTPTFTAPGPKTLTLVKTPTDGEDPETVTVNIVVANRCIVTIRPPTFEDPNVLTGQIPLNTPAEFGSVVDPPGGTYEWSAPGGSPSQGFDPTFTTQYDTEGPRAVTLLYRPTEGGECSFTLPVYAGVPDCEMAISGPTLASPNKEFFYSVSTPTTLQGDWFIYRVLLTFEEDSEMVNRNFGEPSPYPFSVVFPVEGTYRIDVLHIGVTTDNATEVRCEASLSVLVTSSGELEPLMAPGDTINNQSTEGLTRQTGLHYYARRNLLTGAVTRGKAGRNGIAHPRPIRLRANTPYRMWILQAETLKIATADFTTPGPGGSIDLPTFILRPQPTDDEDMDGLSALAEFIVGTSRTNPDTDGDGVPDGIEVQLGRNPLSATTSQVGIIASVDTPGIASDVATNEELVAVADGPAGLALFNAYKGLPPLILAQVPTPGSATAVAMADGVALVAMGEAGLQAFDVAAPATPVLLYTRSFASPVRAVEAGAGLAFAGLQNGVVVGLDLRTGDQLGLGFMASPVHDLKFGADRLYGIGGSSASLFLYTFSLYNPGSLILTQNAIFSPGTIGAGQRRPRLFAGEDVLYVTSAQGYNTFSLATPSNPSLIAQGSTAQFGWKQIVLNDRSRGIAAVSPNSTDDGEHHISLYDTSDSTQVDVFEEEIETPGLAAAVAALNGLNYVADSAFGMHVVNALPFDIGAVPPTISLRTNQALGLAEEGRLINIIAVATDDVMVRSVEFFVDGVRRATDGSYPFEYRFRVPLLSEASEIRVSARATDTGGNRAESAELVLTIVEDATPPFVVTRDPAPFEQISTRTNVLALFSEPLDPATIQPDSFLLYSAGVDGLPGTEDDVVVPGEIAYDAAIFALRFIAQSPLLADGYRAVVSGALADPAGNAMGADVAWTFTVRGPTATFLHPPCFSTAARGSVTEVRVQFDAEMNPATITVESIVLTLGGSPVPISSVDYDAATRVATWTLDGAVPAGSLSLQLQSGMRDIIGNNLTELPSCSVHVRGLEPSAFFPPQSAEIDPGLNFASVTFPEPIDPDTLTVDSFRVTDQFFSRGSFGGAPLPNGVITWDADTNTATITYPVPFASRFHEIVVMSDILDSFGGNIETSSSGFQVIRPSIVATEPQANERFSVGNAPTEATIVLSHPVDPSTVENHHLDIRSAGPDGRSFTTDDEPLVYTLDVAPDGLSIMATFDASLATGVYNLRVDFGGFADLFGNTFEGLPGYSFYVDGAETLTWVGGTGNWRDPAKWDAGRRPTSGDTVIIPAGSYTVLTNLDDIYGASITVGGGGTGPTLQLRGTLVHLGGGDITVSAGATLDSNWASITAFTSRRCEFIAVQPGARLVNHGTYLFNDALVRVPLVNHGTTTIGGNDAGRRETFELVTNHAGALYDAQFRYGCFAGLDNFGTLHILKNPFLNITMFMGSAEAAILYNAPDATINITGTRTLDNFDILVGGLLVNEGTFNATMTNQVRLGSLIQNSGTWNINTGTVLVTSSAMENSGTINVASGATLSAPNVNSTFLAASTLSGGGITNFRTSQFRTLELNGIIAPSGDLAINGNPIPLSATSELRVTLRDDEDYDRIDSDGTVNLDGLLVISVADGYDPAVGTTFTIATAASLSGGFANVSVSGLAVGKLLVPTVEENTFVLTVAEP